MEENKEKALAYSEREGIYMLLLAACRFFTYSASFTQLTTVHWKNTSKEDNSTPGCGRILKLEAFT